MCHDLLANPIQRRIRHDLIVKVLSLNGTLNMDKIIKIQVYIFLCLFIVLLESRGSKRIVLKCI